MGAAADDDDASRARDVVEQGLHQCEVAEVVHSERHLDTVGGPLGARHHLNAGIADDRVQWRQRGASEGVDECAHRRQRREIHLEHRAPVGVADLFDGLGSAGRVAHGEHHVPGRVVREHRASAFQPESGAGSGDDRGPR